MEAPAVEENHSEDKPMEAVDVDVEQKEEATPEVAAALEDGGVVDDLVDAGSEGEETEEKQDPVEEALVFDVKSIAKSLKGRKIVEEPHVSKKVIIRTLEILNDQVNSLRLQNAFFTEQLGEMVERQNAADKTVNKLTEKVDYLSQSLSAAHAKLMAQASQLRKVPTMEEIEKINEALEVLQKSDKLKDRQLDSLRRSNVEQQTIVQSIVTASGGAEISFSGADGGGNALSFLGGGVTGTGPNGELTSDDILVDPLLQPIRPKKEKKVRYDEDNNPIIEEDEEPDEDEQVLTPLTTLLQEFLKSKKLATANKRRSNDNTTCVESLGVLLSNVCQNIDILLSNFHEVGMLHKKPPPIMLRDATDDMCRNVISIERLLKDQSSIEFTPGNEGDGTIPREDDDGESKKAQDPSSEASKKNMINFLKSNGVGKFNVTNAQRILTEKFQQETKNSKSEMKSVKKQIDIIQIDLMKKLDGVQVDHKIEAKFDAVIQTLEKSIALAGADEAEFKRAAAELQANCEQLMATKANQSDVLDMKKKLLADLQLADQVKELHQYVDNKLSKDEAMHLMVDKEEFTSKLKNLKVGLQKQFKNTLESKNLPIMTGKSYDNNESPNHSHSNVCLSCCRELTPIQAKALSNVNIKQTNFGPGGSKFASGFQISKTRPSSSYHSNHSQFVDLFSNDQYQQPNNQDEALPPVQHHKQRRAQTATGMFRRKQQRSPSPSPVRSKDADADAMPIMHAPLKKTGPQSPKRTISYGVDVSIVPPLDDGQASTHVGEPQSPVSYSSSNNLIKIIKPKQFETKF